MLEPEDTTMMPLPAGINSQERPWRAWVPARLAEQGYRQLAAGVWQLSVPGGTLVVSHFSGAPTYSFIFRSDPV